jgi:hypothetical protein
MRKYQRTSDHKIPDGLFSACFRPPQLLRLKSSGLALQRDTTTRRYSEPVLTTFTLFDRATEKEASCRKPVLAVLRVPLPQSL